MLVERHYFNKKRIDAQANKDNAVAGAKAVLALADECAEAMRIPDDKIDQFEQERVKLANKASKLRQDYPLPFEASICLDVVDRYLDAKVRVLQPMLQAAIAYRLGGKEAFDKVRDPYGSGPFELKIAPGQIEVASKFLHPFLRVCKWTFTLPASDSAK